MPKEQRSKQIRDIQRLLQLDTLPPQVRIDKERHLAALLHEKEVSRAQTHEAKLERKYKLVKFVEHQKAVRRLRQARTAHLSDPSDASKRNDVRDREVDIAYIERFPAAEKYISLYKLTDDGSENYQKSRDRRAEIWKLAEAGALVRSAGGGLKVSKQQRSESENRKPGARKKATNVKSPGSGKKEGPSDENNQEQKDEFFE